jgi:hypothetical protein
MESVNCPLVQVKYDQQGIRSVETRRIFNAMGDIDVAIKAFEAVYNDPVQESKGQSSVKTWTLSGRQPHDKG